MRRRSRAAARKKALPADAGSFSSCRCIERRGCITISRLEADGNVFASWAVPKGPTLVPATDKVRDAVKDHPIDYRDFEGNIPEGQNPAPGTCIVWDRGTYYRSQKANDAADEIADGKIKFVLA